MKKNSFILFFLFSVIPLVSWSQDRQGPKTYAQTIAEPADNIKTTRRPAPSERLFTSSAIEQKIEEVKYLLHDSPYLAWMFENCFPNTLDTTVHYSTTEDGDDDTFVYTGDIHAMWLRDSGAQV